MNNTNDILSTDGTFGQLFAALGASQHVATVKQHTVHNCVHTHFTQLITVTSFCKANTTARELHDHKIIQTPYMARFESRSVTSIQFGGGFRVTVMVVPESCHSTHELVLLHATLVVDVVALKQFL